MTTPLEITCPKCKNPLKGIRPSEDAGKPTVCYHCQHIFHPKVVLTCPQCQSPLRVRIAYLGKELVCKTCKVTFQAPAPEGVASPASTTQTARVENHQTQLQTAGEDTQRLPTQVEELQTSLRQAIANHEASQQDFLQALAEAHKHLKGERQTNADTIAQWQSRIAELEQMVAQTQDLQKALTEANRAKETLQQDSARKLDEARSQWAAERQALQTQWDQQAQARAQEAEDLLRAERLQAQQQRETAQKQFDLETSVLREELNRLRREADALRREQQALLERATAVEQVEQVRHRQTGTQADQPPAVDPSELAAVQSQRDQLLAEVRRLTSQLEERSADANRLDRLTADLEAVRAERDQRQAQRDKIALEVEQLRARNEELARAAAQQKEAQRQLNQTLAEAMAAARSQQAEEVNQLVRERDALRAERDQLLDEKQTQNVAVGQWRDQVADLQRALADTAAHEQAQRRLEEARAQWAAEGQSLRAQEPPASRVPPSHPEVETLPEEAAKLRREREALASQLEALSWEHERLTVTCDDLRRSLAEAEQKLQTAPDPADRVPEEALAERYRDLAEQVQALRQELAQRRPSTPKAAVKRGLLGGWRGGASAQPEAEEDALRNRLDLLRKEVLAEREQAIRKASEAVRINLERQLAEANAQLLEANERIEQLEAELQADRPQAHHGGNSRFDAAHGSGYSGSNSGNSGTHRRLSDSN